MPDSRIEHCLDLCARARDLGGDDLARTLIELQQELRSLHNDNSGPKGDFAPSEPEDEGWKHEPIITMDMNGYLTGWNRGAESVSYTHLTLPTNREV